MKNKIFVGIIIILFFIGAFIIHNVNRKGDFGSSIFFKVDSISISPALRATLYNKEKEKLKLRSYVFYDYHNIKKGDIIKKNSNSEFLEILRLDSVGNKFVVLRIKSK
ncbi:MAG: hypothetical protein GX163_12945 [Bacteroidetes bacterium]|jgi:hypothetical protein|nr:hypothetical protein [Bacteroidota bacterium]